MVWRHWRVGEGPPPGPDRSTATSSMTTGRPAARGRRDPPQPQFRPTTRKAVRNRPGRLSDRPRSRPGPARNLKRVPTPPSGPLPSPLPNPPLVVTGAPKTAGGPIRDLKAVRAPGAGAASQATRSSEHAARRGVPYFSPGAAAVGRLGRFFGSGGIPSRRVSAGRDAVSQGSARLPRTLGAGRWMSRDSTRLGPA